MFLFCTNLSNYVVLFTGGYPNTAGTIPSQPRGLSVSDCVVVPAFPEALCFAFRSDNQGPPQDVQEILGQYEVLRAEFPNAELVASKLEDFFLSVESLKDQLPVYDSEIGDTWIQGIASDPRKCAEVRGVGRTMKHCFDTKACDISDHRIWNASRLFVKSFEHTWGLSEEQDFIHWSNPEFHAVQSSKPFENCATAWSEQRQVLYYAIDALEDHPVAKDVQLELSLISPDLNTPDLSGFTAIKDFTTKFQCPDGMQIQFAQDGSMQELDYNGIPFATPDNLLGQFVYQSYNETDFDNFGKVYNYNGISAGYYKHNLTNNAKADSKIWAMKLVGLYKSTTANCDIYVELAVGDQAMYVDYGSPEKVWIRYTGRGTPQTPGFDVTLQFYNKTVTRLPESITYLFTPRPQPNAKWTMSKLGGLIDPHNVILNGSQYEHVLDDKGIFFGPPKKGITLQLTSLDVPIAILSTKSLPNKSAFPAPLSPIKDTITSVGFNIYNNIWDTNYIFWYPYKQEDKNFKARFTIGFVQS